MKKRQEMGEKDKTGSEEKVYYVRRKEETVTSIVTNVVLVMAFLLIMMHIAVSVQDRVTFAETAYSECVDACSEKHFMGYQLRMDGEYTAQAGDGGELKVYTPTIEEFDRTPCIASCNEMFTYLKTGRRP